MCEAKWRRGVGRQARQKRGEIVRGHKELWLSRGYKRERTLVRTLRTRCVSSMRKHTNEDYRTPAFDSPERSVEIYLNILQSGRKLRRGSVEPSMGTHARVKTHTCSCQNPHSFG